MASTCPTKRIDDGTDALLDSWVGLTQVTYPKLTAADLQLLWSLSDSEFCSTLPAGVGPDG